MLPMTVTEVPRRLEPVARDPFGDPPRPAYPPTRGARREAVERPPDRRSRPDARG